VGTWKGSKWRRFVSYLAYSIFCGILILQMLRVQVLLQEQVRVTFKSMPLLVYSAFFPVIIGILLGIPGFVRTCRQPAAWSFDWVKFIAVGVPSLYGSLFIWLYFSPVGSNLPFASTVLGFGGSTFPAICGIVFGYILIGCFRKAERKDAKQSAPIS
jgi:hypothetical protein